MRVMYFDIETSLMQVYTHYIGSKVSIQPSQIKEHSKIICICYKFSDEKKVHYLHWDPNTQDDSKMLKEFNKIAATADAYVDIMAKALMSKRFEEPLLYVV